VCSIGGASAAIRNNPALKGLNLDFDNMGQISVRPSPLVTKSLLFMAESANIGGDPGGPMFRAYDKKTGAVVHEFKLPGLTSGAPMSYEHRGRQYIAVALSAQGQTAELVVLSLPGARMPSAAGVATTAAATPRPAASTERVEATPAQLATGRQLYAANCVICHGANGEGVQGGSAPALKNTAALADVKNFITRGAPEMPPFGAVLTADQIDALARFVKVGLAAQPPQ
jgi:mono/diheme cytochrome c family protein